MVTGMVGLAGLGVLVVMLVVALMVLPKKNGTQQFAPVLSATFESAAPLRRFSIREQQLDEDADALAGEFKRVQYEQYLNDLRTSAVTAFAPAGKSAKA